MDMQGLELADGIRYTQMMEHTMHAGNTVSNLLNRFSRKILGLDIRSDSVSAVLIKSSLKGIWIEDHLHVDITEEMKTQGDGLSVALGFLVDRMDVTGTCCVASFPFDAVSFRNLEVPFTDKRKIRQVMPFELEPMLPFSMKDLAVDFQIANRKTEGPEKTALIVAAVASEELKSCLDALKSFGIDPETITVSGYAAAFALAAARPFAPENWILADVHSDKVLMYCVVENQIRVVRSVPAFLENGPEKALRLAETIRSSVLAVFEQFGTDGLPQRLILSGCEPGDDGMEKCLEEILGIPVCPLNLIRDRNIRLTNPPDASWRPDRSDNALALCLTETEGAPPFNFRRGPFAKKKFWVEHTSDIIYSGVLAGVVLLMFLTGYIVDAYSLSRKVARIDHEISGIFTSAFPDAKMSGAPLEQMQAKIKEQKKTAIFSDETQSNIRIIDILNDVSRHIPKELDVKVTKLSVSAGNVTIAGDTDKFNSVDDMKNNLEQAKLFTAVTITSANLDRSGNRVDFKLKLQLN
jgi:general secretion pathway protein L